MSKTKRAELLEEKIKQLEMYHDGKCPENKKKTVRMLIIINCRKLSRLCL